MEILILALLLFLGDERSDLKRTLENFLSFYRENRELISIVASAQKETEKSDPIPAKPQEEAQKCGDGVEKTRSEEGAGNRDIFESYLKRTGGSL